MRTPNAASGDEEPRPHGAEGAPAVELYRFDLPDGVRKSVYVVVPLLTAVFYTFVAVLHPAVLHSPRTMWRTIASWCAATVALAVVHEGCHAGVMLLAGAHPRVGIRLRSFQPYALADGFRFRRGYWIATAVAPLLVTVPLAGLLLSLFPNQSWTLVLAIMAPVGCSGDVEMVLRAVRNSARGDLVEDTKRGFVVVRPTTKNPSSAPAPFGKKPTELR